MSRGKRRGRGGWIGMVEVARGLPQGGERVASACQINGGMIGPQDMKHQKASVVRILLGILSGVILSGCATPYMADRKADAKDIFTATVGHGGGAKARLGPVRAGAFFGRDDAGLRGGIVSTDFGDRIVGRFMHGTMDVDAIVFSLECFAPEGRTSATVRGKQFVAGGALGLSASVPSYEAGDEWSRKPWNQHIPYYTQAEVAVGLGGTVRLGVNAGELVDFLLGWTTLDIFSDDLERRHAKLMRQREAALEARREQARPRN